MSEVKEKVAFIKEHEDEIKPIISNSAINQERVEIILKEFETKVFLCEKQDHEHNSDAKRVLVTASQPLAFITIDTIIEQLKIDPRCKAIGLLTDNVAGKKFEDKNDSSFKRIYNKNLPVLVDALKTAEKEPFDVILAVVDTINSPQSVALFAGKSVFGAEKLYFISSGWIGAGSKSSFQSERAKNMDEIDEIFCTDQLSRRILLNQLKEFPKDKVFITGTPIIGALEIDKAKEYTQTGRKKLGIDDNELAVLYIGDTSADYQRQGLDIDKRINEKTFSETLEAMIKLAEAESEKNLPYLYVRIHATQTKRSCFL